MLNESVIRRDLNKCLNESTDEDISIDVYIEFFPNYESSCDDRNDDEFNVIGISELKEQLKQKLVLSDNEELLNEIVNALKHGGNFEYNEDDYKGHRYSNCRVKIRSEIVW